MATRTGSAVWEGTLKLGKGTTNLGSGAFEGPYSVSSRFEEGKGTNPEEMIGAAEAACYSMALSANLEKAGHPAKRITTMATVKLEMIGGGPKITTIELKTEADVPGIDEAKFKEQAELTKKICLWLIVSLAPIRAGQNSGDLLNDNEIRRLAAERIKALGGEQNGVGIVVGTISSEGRKIISAGERSLDDPHPLDGDTVFEIGSVTKVFTALLLAEMAEKNEVGL